ncbi:nitroreductase family protein [Alphaproteobacteria bacterium]|nr:nitroreductase family protein [Alphaproteobacteria bacterium]
MLPLFKQRYSGYSFDKNKAVPLSLLKDILNAARWAPSCYGEEPWRYIICEKGHKNGSYDKVFNTLVKANQKWAKDAPLLIVSVADYIFRKTKKHNRWAAHDTGAASAYLCLQAAASNLMAHPMGGFNGPQIIQDFGLPDECIPMSVIALGYEKVPKEEKERTRQPLSYNFYEEAWKKGLKN